MAQKKDNKTGKWMYYGSYVDKLGKRTQYKKRGFNTKKEAIKAELLYRDNLDQNNKHLDFETLYSEFINYQNKQVKKSTLKTDIYSFNKIRKDFENASNFMEKEFIQNYIDECDKQYSKAYVSKIYYSLRKMFNYALQEGYLQHNPMDRVKMDARKNEITKTIHFWEPSEFNKFILEVDDPMYKVFFMTLFYMGLRKGEAVALQWSDVDFKNKTITINKTYSTKINAITSPKTKNSYRTITMPSILVKELLKWEEVSKQFLGYHCNGFVFGNDKPLAAETLRRKFYKYIQLANSNQRPENQIPYITLHGFRHSHASYLINNMSAGFTDFDIAKRLGDTVSTLHSTYAHWFKAADKNIIDFMDEEFG